METQTSANTANMEKTENLSQFYASVCAEHEVEMNQRVLEVLQETTGRDNVTLNLSGGNSGLERVQRLNDEDVLVLSKCLRNIRSVTGLDLRFNHITDEGAGHLAELLQDSALRSLDLTFNDIEGKGAKVLAKSLQSNSRLLSLTLSGNKISDSGATHLADLLQVNHSLRELQLDDCDLGAQGVIALFTVLKSNRGLLSLDISRPLLFSHQEEWALHLSETLAVNRSLVELHLGKAGLTDTGTERLAEGLRVNHSLRYLDLRCNRVTRDGARHLAVVLKENPTLEIIDLSSNRIEDEGAVCLSEAMTGTSCSLRELSVCSNNIRSEGLLSLARALTLNTSLSHIYIWGNHLQEPVCQAFSQLISSGRLLQQQTDVSPYEVDSQVFLARGVQTLRRHYDRPPHPDPDPGSESRPVHEPIQGLKHQED